MSNICIVKNYYGKLNGKSLRMPRERYTRFYDDLYARFELGKPDLNAYESGDQLTYAELGDAILQQCEADGILNNLDLLVLCYWTPEFDPEYSAGAYFCERYKLKAKTFDICDQGVLAPITAIKVIKSYFNHSDIKNALLICVDQTTIPVPKNHCTSRPKKASATGILISKDPEHRGVDLIHAKVSADSDALFFAGKISGATAYNVGFMESDLPYINCAEIFKPILYQKSVGKHQKSYFMLTVSDVESRDFGFLLGSF